MAQPKILLADNESDFLETRREYLEKEGFKVITASSPVDVQNKLTQEVVDLAIMDIRLLNDDDEKDISGLELAKNINRSLPLIMLTGYPALDYVRQALRPQADGHRIAEDFIAKEDGPEAMVTAAKRILEAVKVERDTALKGRIEYPGFSKHWRTFTAITALLLALGTGIVAMLLGDPKWLIGTVALAILAVFFIGISLSTE